jgi:aryl-alcohol dehydrogenase (NADP+)
MTNTTTPQYITLGNSGLRVPRLWLGAMMFGDQTEESVAREMIAVTRDAGLNAIDTADNYANGESERIVGRLIAQDRSRWVLATKVANAIGKEPNDKGLSRRWVTQEVDNSLKRLGTDWIDVYYMHKDDEVTPIEETLNKERFGITGSQTSVDGAWPVWSRRPGKWGFRSPSFVNLLTAQLPG